MVISIFLEDNKICRHHSKFSMSLTFITYFNVLLSWQKEMWVVNLPEEPQPKLPHITQMKKGWRTRICGYRTSRTNEEEKLEQYLQNNCLFNWQVACYAILCALHFGPISSNNCKSHHLVNLPKVRVDSWSCWVLFQVLKMLCLKEIRDFEK